MTKEDYVLIAAALNNARASMHADDAQRGGHAGWYTVVVHVADALASDNPRFDRAQFMRAAEPQQ